MKKETKHFYFVVGLIFMIMGGFSLVYSAIIPTTFFTVNEIPSLIFRITGIIFIIIGLSLTIVMRKKTLVKKIKNKETISP